MNDAKKSACSICNYAIYFSASKNRQVGRRLFNFHCSTFLRRVLNDNHRYGKNKRKLYSSTTNRVQSVFAINLHMHYA